MLAMKIILPLIIIACMGSTTQLTAQKISRTATISLKSTIDKVFPLFGPIREKEWAHGWDPDVVSGEDDVSEHMVFKTHGRYDDEPEYLWAITKYSPENFLIEYTVTSKERLWFITVQCKNNRPSTSAEVTYTYIGFSKKAEERNAESLGRMFARDLDDWEEAINHYLLTGNQLKD
jgi:hypothetical protein